MASTATPPPVDKLTPNVLVLGDVQLDVVVIPQPGRGDRQDESWKADLQHFAYRRPGGAWLLHRIVQRALESSVSSSENVWTVGEDLAERYCAGPGPPCLVSVANLRSFPEENKGEKSDVYRIADEAVIGWLRYVVENDQEISVRDEGGYPGELRDQLKSVAPEREGPLDLLVLHDHNHGFRGLKPEESIERFFQAGPPKVILLHTSAPLAQGKLWEFLYSKHRDRLVVVVDAGDLRDRGITLPEDFSVERVVTDLMENVARSAPHTPLAQLAQCRCWIAKSPRSLLIHCRRSEDAPGTLNTSHLPYAIPEPGTKRSGRMVGYSLILMAALAKGISYALSRKKPADAQERLDRGIRLGAQLGLVLCEEHRRNGFLRLKEGEFRPEKAPEPYPALFRDANERLGLAKQKAPPWKKHTFIASIDYDAVTLAKVDQLSRIRALVGSKWTSVEEAAIAVVTDGLDSVIHETSLSKDKEELWHLPTRLSFPVARIGKLQLVDREEIDSYSTIEHLVKGYLEKDDWKRPLSIAVFGPPGSGKSFTVKQIIEQAQGAGAPKPLEFNLSQFQSVEELSNAFHIVQDRALMEPRPPVVFFDEFDSGFAGRLGWLKYFLAPMQDGTFRDGHATYRVGRAIFVFAGGICHSFEEFSGLGRMQEQDGQFRDAKGPDFVSRLRGHLNIPGINPKQDAPVTDLLMVRRAILVRAFLEDHWKHVVNPTTKKARIDRGVVRAFLRAPQYEHGARSIEAIVQMATISPSRWSFQRSSVPERPQLAMHVKADEFLSCMHDTPITGG